MKKILAILGIAAIASSCQEVIELDLPDTDPLLVVNGSITDSLPAQVQVSASAPYYSQSLPGISDVQIKVYEDNVLVDSLIESDTLAGFYLGTYRGQVGRSYRIDVEIGDGNPLMGPGRWTSIPEQLNPCAPIDTFFSRFTEAVPPIIQEGYYVLAEFQEPAGVGNNYRIRAWRNDSLQNTPFDLEFYSDELYDGLYLTIVIDGPRPVGTTYKLEISSITTNHLDFLGLLRQQTVQVGSTFDPPPATIVGNMHVEGNPEAYIMGYFNASQTHYKSTVIVE